MFCQHCSLPLFLSKIEHKQLCDFCIILIEDYTFKCDCCGNFIKYQDYCTWCLHPICDVCCFNDYHIEKYNCYTDPLDD